MVLVCNMDHQAVFPGQVFGLEAQALAWQADLELQVLGPEQVQEAAVLPHRPHQDFLEALESHPVFSGMAHKSATSKCTQVPVSHSILAKPIGQVARVPCMVRMAFTLTPLDSEIFTAWELQVPLVPLAPARRNLWRLEA